MLKLLAVAFTLACLGFAVITGRAAAHAEFVTSTPAPDSRLAAPPAQVSIVFTQPVMRTGTAIRVLAPTGATVSGATVVQGNTASVPVNGAGPGVYRVLWTNVSADDGHEKSGEFQFLVVAPEQPAMVAAPPSSAAAPAMPRTGAALAAEDSVMFGIMALAGVLVAGPALVVRQRKD